METGICFSRAERADLDTICEIESKSFGADGFSRRQFIYLITRSRGVFYVARKNGAVVAYISLLIPGNTRHLRIYSVAVSPEARGSGVGAGLIDLAKECALERGLSALSLEVKTTNREAIKLYEKQGFVPKGLLKAYYPDGADAYRMYCRI